MAYTRLIIAEYGTYFLKDGVVSTYFNNDTLKAYALPEPIVTGSAGWHDGVMIGVSGQVYRLLRAGGAVTKLSITDGVSASGYKDWFAVIRKDGSVSVVSLTGKVVTMPDTVRFTKVVAGHVLLALDEQGGVWSYAWNYGSGVRPVTELPSAVTPTKVLTGASDIATSRNMFSAAIVNGDCFTWNELHGAPYVGRTTASKPVLLAMPEKVRSIAASDNTLHLITVTGELYGMGDNAVGEVGNGQLHPQVKATNNWDMIWRLFVSKPVNVSNGKKYKLLEKGNSYGFRTHAQLEDNTWVSWGYGKGGLEFQNAFPPDAGAVGIAAVTVPWPVDITPTIPRYDLAGFKKLVTDGKYPLPVAEVPNIPPVVNAGQDIDVTLPLESLQLEGTAVDTDGTIVSKVWAKVSGPSVLVGNVVTPVEGVSEFELTATDNKGAVTKDRVIVTVHPKPRILLVTIKVYDDGSTENI